MSEISLFKSFIDFIFPLKCAACNYYSDKTICQKCLDKLPFIKKPICQRCGKPTLYEVRICNQCRQRNFIFQNRSFGHYKGNLKEIIIKYKFCHYSKLSQSLADLIIDCLPQEFLEASYITYVPMTRYKEKIRGYNQSKLLSIRIAKILGKNVSCLINKDIKTHSQSLLKVDQRLTNLKGVFSPAVKNKLSGSVLIVDDIMTTGTTLQECAKVLKKIGFTKIYTATVARSLIEIK